MCQVKVVTTTCGGWRLAVCRDVSSSNVYDCAMMAFFVTATCLCPWRERRERDGREREEPATTLCHQDLGAPCSGFSNFSFGPGFFGLFNVWSGWEVWRWGWLFQGFEVCTQCVADRSNVFLGNGGWRRRLPKRRRWERDEFRS